MSSPAGPLDRPPTPAWLLQHEEGGEVVVSAGVAQGSAGSSKGSSGRPGGGRLHQPAQRHDARLLLLPLLLFTLRLRRLLVLPSLLLRVRNAPGETRLLGAEARRPLRTVLIVEREFGRAQPRRPSYGRFRRKVGGMRGDNCEPGPHHPGAPGRVQLYGCVVGVALGRRSSQEWQMPTRALAARRRRSGFHPWCHRGD